MSSVNNIREDKSVNVENFEYVLAQSNYNISSIFRSVNHNEIVSDTVFVSGDNTLGESPQPETTSRNHQYSFKVLSATTNSIIDLKDGEINVVASVYLPQSTTSDATMADIPRLGNHALLSLFSSLELYIDSTLIERIDYPGMLSNADYALRYNHNPTSEKLLESNGYIRPLEDAFVVEVDDSSATTTYDGVYKYSNDSVVWGLVNPSTGNDWIRGVITQRLRLQDIFPCISTLPPIFNHSVTINMVRNSHNQLIASCPRKDDTLQLASFLDFKIIQDSYIITDELKKSALEYYSKPIECIICKTKIIPTGFISKPSADSTMSFNVCIDTAYKNKLAVFAIPRTSNFTNQPACATKPNTKQSYKDDSQKHYDTASAPANSYTFGGLKSFNIYTMNGMLLKSFDMSRDGNVSGTFDEYNKIVAMMDVNENPDSVKINNYQGVYDAYLKSREILGAIPDEGLDFVQFIKENTIFCCDLSGFSISSGENLRLELTFASWDDGYNPFCENNYAGVGEKYLSKQIFTFFYSDKILRLLPNQNVELADLFQARTEADETNQI